jgi:hypothetical protein
VFLGQGGGVFSGFSGYAAGNNPTDVAVGDTTGDGFPDIAVPNNQSNGTISVLVNDANWPGPIPPIDPRDPAIQPPAPNGTNPPLVRRSAESTVHTVAPADVKDVKETHRAVARRLENSSGLLDDTIVDVLP